MPRRGKRLTKITVRVSPTRRMKAAELRLLLDQAIRTGTIPEGIKVWWVDWERGKEGAMTHGHSVHGEAVTALRAFGRMLTAAGVSTRFARVRQ